MNFVKVDDSYIDLSKVVTVTFDDKDLNIYFYSPGFDDYRLFISFDNKKKYYENKCYLIKELIKCSINDCEVVECQVLFQVFLLL